MLRNILFISALALSTPALAADTYIIDKTHTNIIWGASHLGFSKSFGTFSEVSGQFTLDETAPEASTVEITVGMQSVVTGIPKFDNHLKSKDFFDVETHPTATFKSTKVELTGEKTAKIHGELTMLGQTHPLALDATLNKVGVNGFNKKHTAGFSLTGSIDRSLYGMEYGVPGIPASVDLIIEAEGIKQTPNPKADAAK
jgi:polyisoprenoid-binding protein YceI